MSSMQFIYFEKVSYKKLQVLMENVLQVSMIHSEQPDWFFYYDDENIGISVGMRQTLNPEHVISLCSRPIRTEMMIAFRAPTHNLVSADIVAVKCLNAILKEFDTDVIFMFEDDTLRLVRCQGQVLLNWSGSLKEENFWNRPDIEILDKLTIPYKNKTFNSDSIPNEQRFY